MIIDTHQHFWYYNDNNFDWITDDMAILRKNYLPEDLEPVIDSVGVSGTVLVQVEQREEENELFINFARQHSFIKGVVGWLDLKAGDLDEKLATYSENNYFKGVRHILQTEPDGFMTDPEFVKGVSRLNDYNFTYDVLTTESQLAEVVEFLHSLPEMKIVIDHISKPNIKAASIEHWMKYMKEISKISHVHVKLSGMITEADWQNWTVDQLRPYVDFCLENFGADRLMFGSDWPVCQVAGNYGQVHLALDDCLVDLSSDERAQIWGLTAQSFYNLDI